MRIRKNKKFLIENGAKNGQFGAWDPKSIIFCSEPCSLVVWTWPFNREGVGSKPGSDGKIEEKFPKCPPKLHFFDEKNCIKDKHI